MALTMRRLTTSKLPGVQFDSQKSESRSRCAAPRFRASDFANLVFPLPAGPTTATRKSSSVRAGSPTRYLSSISHNVSPVCEHRACRGVARRAKARQRRSATLCCYLPWHSNRPKSNPKWHSSLLQQDLIRTRAWTGFSPRHRRCSQLLDQLILATHILNVVIGELLCQSRFQFFIFDSLVAVRSEIVAQS